MILGDVGENDVRLALQLGEFGDHFRVLKLIECAINVAAVAGRFVRKRRQCLDHLAGQIEAQRIARFDNVILEHACHRAGWRAIAQDMRRSLGRQDAAIEIR